MEKSVGGRAGHDPRRGHLLRARERGGRLICLRADTSDPAGGPSGRPIHRTRPARLPYQQSTLIAERNATTQRVPQTPLGKTAARL